MTTPHPAKGIKDILTAAGIFSGGWTGTLGKLVDQDNSIAILDTGGRSSEPRLALDYPSVQVFILGSKVVATGYPDAYAKAIAIKNALLGIPSAPTQYPELTMCNQLGEINPLGYNENDRPQLSLNFQLITEPVPSGYRVSL